MSGGRWDSAYRGEPPPWEIGGPQPIVREITARGGFAGDVLDAGCGTGENAMFLAEQGFGVVGADWSSVAIQRARAKAAERGLQVAFEVVDALELETLHRTFDSVLDSGLFHTFDDAGRVRYVAGLAAIVRPRGVVHLVCFSDRERWGGGPRRVTRAEIREAFADGWDVRAIEPARFATRLHDGGALAWHATVERW